MKVAVVSSVYNPGRGYQENIWPDLLHEFGHEVMVITSNHFSGGQIQDDVQAEYPVHRVDSIWLPHKVLIHKRNVVASLLKDFQPDVILWIDPCSYFGFDIIRYKKRIDPGVKLVSFYGENSSQHKFLQKKKPLNEFIAVNGWKVIRGFIYRQVMPIADINLHTVLETRDILSLVFSRSEYSKIEPSLFYLPLGFDEKKFFFSPSLREETRQTLGVQGDEILLVMSSRFTRFKIDLALRKLIKRLARYMADHHNIKLLIIGLIDNEVCNAFAEEIKTYPASERMLLEPLVDQEKLNSYYNASDLTFFQLASISSQQSMGTGTYVMYIQDGSMDALHESDKTGYGYQDTEEDFFQGIDNYLAKYHSESERQARIETNSRLGYRGMVRKFLEVISDKGGNLP
jgi:hypothetical protein